MSKIIFQLAEESDDSAIRRILRSTPMDGNIRLSFQREPSYFHTTKVEGKFSQILIARNTGNNDIVGLGSRSIRPIYINGEVWDAGYLSSLRINKSYRGTTLLASGYKFLRDLHQDKKALIYLTTIQEDNKRAIKTLTSKRAGLPTYHDIGSYCTTAVNLFRKKKGITGDFKITRGAKEHIEGIMECIHRNGVEKQFYPYYSKEDYFSGNSRLRDFRVEDFYLAISKNKVIGVLAKWDQSHFKQNVVTGYNGRMKLIYPFYNLCARFGCFSPLPAPNSQLKSFYISFIAIESNDIEIFRALLREVYNSHVGTSYSYFLVGLHSRDPLLRALEEYRRIEYKTRIYVVCWEDGEGIYKKLDDRIPYLEVGTL